MKRIELDERVGEVHASIKAAFNKGKGGMSLDDFVWSDSAREMPPRRRPSS